MGNLLKWKFSWIYPEPNQSCKNSQSATQQQKVTQYAYHSTSVWTWSHQPIRVELKLPAIMLMCDNMFRRCLGESCTLLRGCGSHPYSPIAALFITSMFLVSFLSVSSCLTLSVMVTVTYTHLLNMYTDMIHTHTCILSYFLAPKPILLLLSSDVLAASIHPCCSCVPRCFSTSVALFLAGKMKMRNMLKWYNEHMEPPRKRALITKEVLAQGLFTCLKQFEPQSVSVGGVCVCGRAFFWNITNMSNHITCFNLMAGCSRCCQPESIRVSFNKASPQLEKGEVNGRLNWKSYF